MSSVKKRIVRDGLSSVRDWRVVKDHFNAQTRSDGHTVDLSGSKSGRHERISGSLFKCSRQGGLVELHALHLTLFVDEQGKNADEILGSEILESDSN